MITEWHDDDALTDPKVSCDDCEALCCRLTVVLMPDEVVPEDLVQQNEQGTRMLVRGADGRCMALDRESFRCSIYQQRPKACRRFAMGAGYCRSLRADDAARRRPAIPLVLVG